MVQVMQEIRHEDRINPDSQYQERKIISELLKKKYNGLAIKYQECEDISGWSNHSLCRQIAAFRCAFLKLTINKESNILDVGCGSGIYSKTLAEMGYNLTAIDFAEQAIYKAAGKSEGKNVQYVIADAYFLPFKDESFDVTICNGVLQHIPDQKIVISEMKRVLKDKQGVMILITLNSCSRFLRKLFRKFVPASPKKCEQGNIRKHWKLIYRNPFDTKKELEDIGFGEIEVKGIYIFHKILTPLELLFEKCPFLIPQISHMFIVKALRLK